ncbi:MAG: hypothetical protein SFV20_14920 [Sphingopyxis sp.]|nr:hypothetical protein [Sphingopyxis sp.]
MAAGISATVVLTLAACSSPDEQDNQITSPGLIIAPGTYTDVSGEGDGDGWRLTLPQGEASKTIAVAYCAPECAAPTDVPLRAGMGGLMVEYPLADGRSVALAIRSHGNGLEVATDWGNGLESYKLAREEGVSAPPP